MNKKVGRLAYLLCTFRVQLEASGTKGKAPILELYDYATFEAPYPFTQQLFIT